MPAALPASSALAVEGIVGCVGHAQQRAGLLAPTFGDAALGIDALNRRDVAELAIAATCRHLEFEQWDVACTGGGRTLSDFRDHGATVVHFPVRTGVVPPDRLSSNKQRGDRLAELPPQTARGIGLALIDLGAGRVD